jgi:hypothetical protein
MYNSERSSELYIQYYRAPSAARLLRAQRVCSERSEVAHTIYKIYTIYTIYTLRTKGARSAHVVLVYIYIYIHMYIHIYIYVLHGMVKVYVNTVNVSHDIVYMSMYM